jgi:excisionase family DNA binding protein
MDDYLSIAEVADIYGVSQKTVRRWVSRFDVKAYRMPGGRLLRIDAASLDGILEPVNYRGYVPRRGRR